MHRLSSSLVQNHDLEDIRHTEIPLQVRAVVPQLLGRNVLLGADLDDRHGRTALLVGSGRHHIRAGDGFPIDGVHDHVADVGLLEAVGPDGALLDGVEHDAPLVAGGEARQLGVEDLAGQRAAAGGDLAQEVDEPGHGLGEDAGLRVGVHALEDPGVRVVEDEGAVVRVEDGGEHPAQAEEVYGVLVLHGELLQGRGKDAAAEVEDCLVWDGGDMVVMYDEEGV